MLFYMFSMFDDYWRINHQSRNSAGKSVVKTPILRRTYSDEKHPEAPTIPDDGGSQKGRPRWGLRGPHHMVARVPLPACGHMVWLPWSTSAGAPSRTLPLRTLRLGEPSTKSSAASTGQKLAREKSSPVGRICRGNSFPERGDRRHRHHHQAGLYWDHHHLRRHIHRSTPFCCNI